MFTHNKRHKAMLLAEFSQSLFKPQTDDQLNLFQEFKTCREKYGLPHRFRFLRNLAKTRKHTRTIYPPGWSQSQSI